MLQIQNLIINFQAEEAHAVEDLDAAAAKAALAEVSGGKTQLKNNSVVILNNFLPQVLCLVKFAVLTFQALTSLCCAGPSRCLSSWC